MEAAIVLYSTLLFQPNWVPLLADASNARCMSCKRLPNIDAIVAAGRDSAQEEDECKELSKYGEQAGHLAPSVLGNMMQYAHHDMSTFGYTWDVLGLDRPDPGPSSS